jgi:hypothetical protein
VQYTKSKLGPSPFSFLFLKIDDDSASFRADFEETYPTSRRHISISTITTPLVKSTEQYTAPVKKLDSDQLKSAETGTMTKPVIHVDMFYNISAFELNYVMLLTNLNLRK